MFRRFTDNARQVARPWRLVLTGPDPPSLYGTTGSIRGLKEPWTLKLRRKHNTSNRWALAGGAKPADWPCWMRGREDY